MMRFITALSLVGIIGFFGYRSYGEIFPCARVVEYAIGEVDVGFGLSSEDFLDAVKDAERVWEDEAGKELFSYNPDASFKVNLIYDERQERTLESENDQKELQAEEEMLRGMEKEFGEEKARVDTLRTQYENRLRTYERDLAAYNRSVESHNQNGGMSAVERERFNAERASLRRRAENLAIERSVFNQSVDALNTLGGTLGEQVVFYNEQARRFNEKYGFLVEFNQGLYTGDSIDIYQFSSREDLHVVLAHEFGHAIGIGHVDDPSALMYYKIDSEVSSNRTLTLADKEALKTSCRL